MNYITQKSYSDPAGRYMTKKSYSVQTGRGILIENRDRYNNSYLLFKKHKLLNYFI